MKWSTVVCVVCAVVTILAISAWAKFSAAKPEPGARSADLLSPTISPKSAEQASSPASSGGIQWFATWESGLREAERTGRPILLVSGAPHCAGVSGIW